MSVLALAATNAQNAEECVEEGARAAEEAEKEQEQDTKDHTDDDAGDSAARETGEACVSVREPLAPVGMGVWKGTVAVGVPVYVITTRVEDVGRTGAEAETVGTIPPDEPPAINAQVPEALQ